MKHLSFLWVILLLFLLECQKPTEPKEAKFVITGKEKGMTDYDCPYVLITVKNIGNATGYNVACRVHAKRDDTIIDTGFAYFADGGNIAPGESAQDDAVFFDLSSHSDYTSLKYELSWLTRN